MNLSDKKKKDQELEVKELLKIVEGHSRVKIALRPDVIVKPKAKPSIERTRKIHNFISENKIASGKYMYEAFIMYEWFLHWGRHRVVKVSPLSYKKFVNLLKVFIKWKNLGNEIHFYINLNLRQTYLNPHREGAIRRWKKHEEKENKKAKKKAYEKAKAQKEEANKKK